MVVLDSLQCILRVPIKNNPILKAILIAGIFAMLGYIALDIPKDDIADVVDTYLPEVLESADTTQNVQQLYAVATVIDGDTFTYLKDGEPQTVRVLGINTPETKYVPKEKLVLPPLFVKLPTEIKASQKANEKAQKENIGVKQFEYEVEVYLLST